MKKFFFLMALATMVLGAHAEATIGYLMTMNNKDAFPAETFEGVDEKPEYNAATWFENTYINKGIGRYVTLPEAAMGDLSALKAIWVNVDRMGLENLELAGISADVVAGLKKYVENGGNLFVTKQANQIIYQMGRMGYAPTWANGGYHVGGDHWQINPHLCLWPAMGGAIHRDEHPIFKGMTTETRTFEFTYEGDAEPTIVEFTTFPLVGAVSRTDNNNFWIDYFRKDPVTGGQMEPVEGVTHYDNGNILRLTDYEADWNLQVLSVWGHVLDNCSGGLVIFNPEGNFKGTIISCGFAAYQWGTSNDFIANVQQLSANALEILAGTGTAVENVTADKTIKGVYNLLGQKVERENMVRGNIYIVDGQKIVY